MKYTSYIELFNFYGVANGRVVSMEFLPVMDKYKGDYWAYLQHNKIAVLDENGNILKRIKTSKGTFRLEVDKEACLID